MIEPSTIAPAEPTTPPATTLTPSSTIKLLPYTARAEGEDYLIGVPQRDLYFAVPAVGVDILRMLGEGRTIQEIAQHLADTDDGASINDADAEDAENSDDDYDVIDFVQTLVECGIVAEIDGGAIAADLTPQRTFGLELFPRLQGTTVRWITSPAMIGVDLALLALAGVLLWRVPAYRPSSADFFVHPWYTLNTLIILLTALPLVFLHEFGHLCAARAEGVSGRLSMGRRLFALVTQFHVENIWQISRPRRILIYLAGMAMNLRIFVAALVLLVWLGTTLPHPLAAWLRLVLILEWTATAWQFQVFMKTDVYYLVADVLGVPTLMEDARAYLRGIVARVFGRTTGDESRRMISRIAIRLFAAFYLVGVAIASVVFFTYALPFTVRTVGGAIQTLMRGPGIGLAPFSDAAVAITLYSLYMGLLAAFWAAGLWRSSTNRRKA